MLDLIDDMVNLRTFGRQITHRPTNLLPNTSTDQRMFAILLGDFLALPQPRGGGAAPFGLPAPTQDETGSARIYLRYQREIAAKPSFSFEIVPLAKEVDAFATERGFGGESEDRTCVLAGGHRRRSGRRRGPGDLV